VTDASEHQRRTNELLEPYVPRFVVSWLAETPERTWQEIEGSLAFVDISGFTQLTERLARKGKVGAEEMSDILNATFADLLSVAYKDGAGLVKWGGDAVLLLFQGEDHAARAARASYRMRARMAEIGKVSTGSGRVVLRMSVGIHSGRFHFFLVGDPAIHRELLISGPAASVCAQVEGVADADEIGLSPEAAALLDPAVVGEPKGDALLLAACPDLEDLPVPPRPPTDGVDLSGLIPPLIRRHVLSAEGHPEHRRIAVAFVQFSGTDALLAEEGPEVLAAALDEAMRNVQEATSRHSVTFFETDINADGGKVMLTAGAPASADHDEERMLRATRRIVDRIGRLPLRIGVNCGPVFAGDFGPPFRKTFSVKGDAINLAARVMGKAKPGQLLATNAVLERSATQFDLEPLPPFMVKGKSMPIEAASVGPIVGERAAEQERTPLLGREREMDTLRLALEAARSGQGRVVDLVGEPGIGKSRLVQELLAETELPALVTRCDEYERETAYWPFRSVLRSLLEVGREAPDDVVAEALRERVSAAAPELAPWLPLVAQVLDVDHPSTPEVDALGEEFRKPRLLRATVEVLDALLTGPTVLVVDDAHLMDEASVDLTRELARGVGSRRLLVVITRRDVEEGYVPEPTDELVALRPGPLGPAASSALVAHELAGASLTPADIESLTARAGGNPLFLRGLVLAASTGAAVDSLPETVEALITSQIDRLPPDERTVLRFASVLGVEFHEDELRALLHGHPLPTGHGALRRLSYFIRSAGHGRYRFDHRLIRDTAYEGLPFRLRRMLHGRAGELLESTAADPHDVAELLSLHYFHAHQPRKAWHYSRVAGESARSKYAYVQAEELYARAEASARRLRGVEPVERAEVRLALGEARFRLGRNAGALEAYRAGRALLREHPHRAALVRKDEASIHYRLSQYRDALTTLSRGLRLLEGDESPESLSVRSMLEGAYAVVRGEQGRFRDALRWAQRSEQHARASGDDRALADALSAVHGAYSLLGREPDQPYGEQALALYEKVGDRVGMSRALNNLGFLAWQEGRGEESLEMFQRAAVLADEAGDTGGAASTRYNVGDVLLRLGRVNEAEDLLEDLLPVLLAMGVEDFHAAARRVLGLALVLGDDRFTGRVMLEEARETLESLGEPAEVVETDAARVTAMLLDGDVDDAVELADDAIGRAEALDAGYLVPWLRRLRGAALSDAGRLEEARAELELALSLSVGSSRVERGFVLAELARVARRAGRDGEAERRTAEAERAFDELGFVGGPRYERAGLTVTVTS
jgi:class 3 adenylate cyclase/tetratricopeptide (TPR) repeat protein